KPNPEPFVAAAECLGLSAEKILFVGNSYEYDVVGAHRAGMHAAHITSGKPNTADFTFSRFSELGEWLESRLPPPK
ncbi:MAG: HAD family hydrolase, partial [Spirochaetaceae bacterium]